MALGAPAAGYAQGFRVTGQVVRVTAGDSVPVQNRLVVLHEVALTGGRPVDSTYTNRQGRYRLLAQTLDTTVSYLVSVDHDGIGYFSTPLQTSGQTADTASTLVVYDTAYAGSDIVLVERHLIVRAADEDGSRRVIELIVLENRGTSTRITSDTSRPVWQGAIPHEAMELEVGQSDVSAQAVYRRGDSVAIAAPIPPGEKQILVSYLIPGSVEVLTIPLDHPVARLTVLLEDTTASIAQGPLVLRGMEELDDTFFYRYNATAVAEGTPLAVRFASQPLSLVAFWWVVVPLSALALGGGLWWWLRHAQAAAPVITDGDTLAARIAALDEAFEARADKVTSEERQAYRRQRAELKSLLQAALARRHRSG